MAALYRALRIQGGVRSSHRNRTEVSPGVSARGQPVSKTTIASLEPELAKSDGQKKYSNHLPWTKEVKLIVADTAGDALISAMEV
jgi:hypothetical protein